MRAEGTHETLPSAATRGERGPSLHCGAEQPCPCPPSWAKPSVRAPSITWSHHGSCPGHPSATRLGRASGATQAQGQPREVRAEPRGVRWGPLALCPAGSSSLDSPFAGAVLLSPAAAGHGALPTTFGSPAAPQVGQGEGERQPGGSGHNPPSGFAMGGLCLLPSAPQERAKDPTVLPQELGVPQELWAP